MASLKNKQKVLAEALQKVFELSRELGLEFGNGENVVESKMIAIPKGKPELKREKVARYTYLLSTGKKQSKAELMRKII